MASDPDNRAHESTKPPISIAIVGGGISGLCLALGILNQAPRVNIHIYEAAPRFSELGAGLAFGINAKRALFMLDPRLKDVFGRLRTTNVDSNVDSDTGDDGDGRRETYLRFVMGMDHKTHPDFKTGKELCEVFCKGGFSSVHRARFLDSLVALLPDDVVNQCVTFDAKLVSIEGLDDISMSSGVKLVFADGRMATADAVIGCDGVRSQTRRALLGDDSPATRPVFSGKYTYRGLIPMEKAVAALGHRSARNSYHRVGYGGHVLTFPIDRGNTMNVVAFRTKADGRWPEEADWIKAVTKQDMHRDYEGWGDEVHSILDMMERCDMWALFDHPPAPMYHKGGRICLVGDAAHASTPHQGSGAGMAVEDAFLISGLLGGIADKDDLEHVFAIYETVRKERTQRLVESSRDQAALYDFEAEGIEDDVYKLAHILPRRWDWIWDRDVEKELEEAKVLLQRRLR